MQWISVDFANLWILYYSKFQPEHLYFLASEFSQRIIKRQLILLHMNFHLFHVEGNFGITFWTVHSS